MKCPKCGYHSFEYLESCKKCGIDLSGHKKAFGLFGFLSPEKVVAPAVAETGGAIEEEAAPADDGFIDIGFDLMEEENETQATPVATTAVDDDRDKPVEPSAQRDVPVQVGRTDEIESDEEAFNLDHMFDIDFETTPDGSAKSDKDDKKGPGSEYSF